jgi:biopolymer transport protein ExbB/TolQ
MIIIIMTIILLIIIMMLIMIVMILIMIVIIMIIILMIIGAWEEKESEHGALDESTIAHIAAAETLLKELQPKARDPMRFKVLESYCALATRQKANVDRAMQNFIQLLEQDQDYLPAVLGMATGCVYCLCLRGWVVFYVGYIDKIMKPFSMLLS